MIEKCPRCGKQFCVGPQGWGYAYGSRHTCSYSCMRAMARKEEDKVTEEQKALADQLEADGLKAGEIAKRIGVNRQNIYDYQSRKRRTGGGNMNEVEKVVQEARARMAAEGITARAEDIQERAGRAPAETPTANAVKEKTTVPVARRPGNDELRMAMLKLMDSMMAVLKEMLVADKG